jgi:hypothetical protein
MVVFIGVPLVLYAVLDALIRGKQNKKRKKAEEASKDEADKLKEELEKLKAQLGEKEE